MSSYSDRVLTETYKDKRYEEDLTQLYFRVMNHINAAHAFPTIEYIKVAYGSARAFSEALVYSRKHLLKYQELIRPTLRDVQTILFGDMRDPFVAEVSLRYGCRVFKKAGKLEVTNGEVILNQLSEIVFLVKQYAYEQGLLLPKPMDKKYGIDAVEENLRM